MMRPLTNEETEVANLIEKESTENLKRKLQHLHQTKLGVQCLTNPRTRDKVDIVVDLINIELRKRKV